jgi:hypothetical protein
MDSVDEALTQVVRNPHLYPVVYRNLRRAVVRRFPFAVFYDVTEDEIQVMPFSIRVEIPRDGSRGSDSTTLGPRH